MQDAINSYKMIEHQLLGNTHEKEEGKIEALIEAIKNIMKNIYVDALTAMKSLEIEEKDHPFYLNLLQENK